MSTTIMFCFILEKFRQHFPIVLQVHKMEKVYYLALSKYAPREQKERLSKFLTNDQAEERNFKDIMFSLYCPIGQFKHHL